MLGCGFFFFDILVDEARDAAATETAGGFVFGFAVGIAHETPIKRFLSADIIVVVERELAALTAL
jgi:hypothetical protein